ncbi:ArsR/SmtB family transcription factor [Tistrella bauzanensis]
MEAVAATRMFQALANETRLAVFRLLMRAEPDGLAAGAIAVCLGVVPSTLSAHLKELERAGLVTVERQGRQLIYRAETGGARALIGFLIADCCGGHPDVCADLQVGAACGPLAAPAAPRLPIEAQMTDTPSLPPPPSPLRPWIAAVSTTCCSCAPAMPCAASWPKRC